MPNAIECDYDWLFPVGNEVHWLVLNRSGQFGTLHMLQLVPAVTADEEAAAA